MAPRHLNSAQAFCACRSAKNPLDATAVHPESYPAAKGLLEACGCDAKEIGTDAMQSLPGTGEELAAPKPCAKHLVWANPL